MGKAKKTKYIKFHSAVNVIGVARIAAGTAVRNPRADLERLSERWEPCSVDEYRKAVVLRLTNPQLEQLKR